MPARTGTPGGGQPDQAAKAPEPGADLAVDYDPDLAHAGDGVPRGGRPALSDPRPQESRSPANSS